MAWAALLRSDIMHESFWYCTTLASCNSPCGLLGELSGHFMHCSPQTLLAAVCGSQSVAVYEFEDYVAGCDALHLMSLMTSWLLLKGGSA